MKSLSFELTLATGAGRFPRNWDETDVPAVVPRDLAAALRCHLAMGRMRPDHATAHSRETIDETERRVLELFAEDPARALAVLLRVRSVLAALEARRFRGLAEGRDPSGMLRLVVAAASLRLNAHRGLSPVRLAWACAVRASEGATADDMPTAIAA